MEKKGRSRGGTIERETTLGDLVVPDGAYGVKQA